ncbi:hypothetical protein [Streptomyces sp. SM11]|uniref:hypothetical protein n=1 Tax=Streptomyces sp. SM11 TaxID=565557 RepID=UPI0035BB9EB1
MPGTLAEVLAEGTVRAALDLDCRIIEDPVSSRPPRLPIGRRHALGRAGALSVGGATG